MDRANNSDILELSRELVNQLAPEELPIFPALAEAYVSNPSDRLRSRSGSDDSLGFGTGAEIILLTPAILNVSHVVMTFIAQEAWPQIQPQVQTAVVHAGVGFAGKGVLRLLAHVRRRGIDAASSSPPLLQQLPPLTGEQLERIRQSAFEEARRLDLSEDRASVLADAVAGNLAARANADVPG
jgi:hypothetical protein